jgi:uncharacterized protein YbaP (TraB family)
MIKQRKVLLAIRCLIIPILLNSIIVHSVFAGDRVFMWKVDSQQATAYILGTVHMLRAEMYPLDARIQSAFQKADAYVMEFNINEVGASQKGTMMTDMLYRGDDTIGNHVSRETFDLAQKKIESYGLPFAMMSRFKPWSMAVTIEMFEYRKLGLDPQYGIDKYFLKKAEGDKKIIELESFDSQMELFNSMSDPDQELFLIYSLKEVDDSEKNMDVLLNAWREGDSKVMERLMFKNADDDSRLSRIYEKLFYERNRNMADKIAKMLSQKGTYFIAVGAGHLVGKRGIIDRLSRQGYAVCQQ